MAKSTQSEFLTGIFLAKDAKKLLKHKFFVIFGDSVQRAIYKDLVLLLQRSVYLTDSALRSKGEMTVYGDTLLAGGRKGKMMNGAAYREVREYKGHHIKVRFYFITRCWSDYVQSIICELSAEKKAPDVIMCNSCLWDITRYNPRTDVEEYQTNLVKLFDCLKKTFPPPKTMILWPSTLPIASFIKAGFLAPDSEYLQHTLRVQILAANFHIGILIRKYGFDFVDLHYHFQRQVHRRARDGVHWDQTANRRMTNLILTHVSKSWGVTLPRYKRPPKSTGEIQHAFTSKKPTNQYSLAEILNPQLPMLLPTALPKTPPSPVPLVGQMPTHQYNRPVVKSKVVRAQVPEPGHYVDFTSDDIFYSNSNHPRRLINEFDIPPERYTGRSTGPTRRKINFASNDTVAHKIPGASNPAAPVHRGSHKRSGTFPMHQPSKRANVHPYRGFDFASGNKNRRHPPSKRRRHAVR